MENSRVCLDSDIISNILKNKHQSIDLSNSLVYTTIINFFEISCWETKKPIDEFLKSLKIVGLEINDAKLSLEIYKKLKQDGNILDYRDIFIASICINNNLKLLTENKKHFERLKEFGLEL